MRNRYSDQCQPTLFPIPYSNEEWRTLQLLAVFMHQNATHRRTLPSERLTKKFALKGTGFSPYPSPKAELLDRF